MKAILKILFVLLFIFITIIITGLFLPKEHKIVWNEEINVSPLIVYEQISNFIRWNDWSPFIKNDTAIVISYGNSWKGKGGTMQWLSNKIGNCDLTITHGVSPESVAVDFNFGTNSKTTSLWYIEPRPFGSKVNWTLNLTGLSLFERYFFLFYKSKMKKTVQDGLKDLKFLCMKLKYSRIGDIEIVNLEAQPAVTITALVNIERIEDKIEKLDNSLMRFFERRDMLPEGNAFRIVYETINDTLVKFTYGIPLEDKTWVWSTMSYKELPSGKAVSVSHYGGFNTEKAHNEIKRHIKKNSLIQSGYPWEVYMYNKDTDLDTSLWETKVYFPIE